MGFYDIPAVLDREIDELDSLVKEVLAGVKPAGEIKAYRVPFGVYEQRTRGTYMVRIRCPGGAVTPAQLGLAADLSRQAGNGVLHLTTRQELQIHDVGLAQVVPTIRRLRAAGLSTRGGGGNTVRNITVSADAGVAEGEPFDVTPWAMALTSRLTAEPGSWTLPRKFKIALSNSSADSAHAQFNDVGFVAQLRDGVHGFGVFVAGGLGRKPATGHLMHDFIPASEAFLTAEAVKQVYAERGNRRNKHAARLRFLWDSLGAREFEKAYSRKRLELAVRGDAALSPALLPNNPSVPAAPPRLDSPEGFDTWRKRYVRRQKQEGRFLVEVPVFLGDLRAEEAASLAEVLAPLGEDVMRATLTQNLLLRNIPEAYLGAVWAVAARVGTLSHEPRIIGNLVVCAGASTCQLGICRPRGLARAVRESLLGSGVDLDAVADARIHVSGCSNSCGQHPAADLGFYGKAGRHGERMYPAYAVVCGGGPGAQGARLAQAAGEVPARGVPRLVAQVASAYAARGGGFAGFMRGTGPRLVSDLCAQADPMPDWDSAPAAYVDWDSQEPFSLAGRGAGECSAGLFDLIELDLGKARELREAVLSAGAQPADAAVRLVTSAARALLITQGVEPKSAAEVFAAFDKHFVGTGLVGGAGAAALAAAAGGTTVAGVDALALLERVEELYRSMDNSFRFAPVSAGIVAAEPAAVPADRVADFRGVACPMNFVKTKIELARMSAGTLLEVLLDDGAPVENVPRSVAAEGHAVLAVRRDGAHWVVRIRKGA